MVVEFSKSASTIGAQRWRQANCVARRRRLCVCITLLVAACLLWIAAPLLNECGRMLAESAASAPLMVARVFRHRKRGRGFTQSWPGFHVAFTHERARGDRMALSHRLGRATRALRCPTAAGGPISRGLQPYCNDSDTFGTVACGMMGPVRQGCAETAGRIRPGKTPPTLPWPTGHAAGPTGRGQGAGRETAPQANRAPLARRDAWGA